MFRQITIVAGLVLAVSHLAACSHFGSSAGETRVSRIDRLIEEKDYHRAQGLLADIQPEDPLYSKVQSKLKAVRKEIWNFERAAIKAAVRYEQKRQWQLADQTFDDALERLPESKILSAAYAQYDQRRQVYKKILRVELLINEGEQLLKDARAYTQIANIEPVGFFTRLEIKAYKDKRYHVSRRLFDSGQAALVREDFRLAQRCLLIANRLHGSPDIEQALKIARVEIDRSRSRVNYKALTAKTFRRMLADYKRMLEDGKFFAAQQRMHYLQKQFSDQRELKALADELQLVIRDEVRRATEEGRKLYSEGQVQEALTEWKRVLPLDPNNADLKSNITRAERVLENIRILTKKQSG